MPGFRTHFLTLARTPCVATACLGITLLATPAFAQGGTVAVTGDGSSSDSSSFKPSVIDSDAGTASGGKNHKAKKKGAGAPEKTKTETASREAMPDLPSGEHAISALVNDQPVTGFEVAQRAMMLSGSVVSDKAKANFEAMIKNPKTTERLKAILNEVAQANQGKTRDQIIAIFEQRKKEFGMSMQKQAFEGARQAAFPAMKKQALEELIDDKLKLQEAKKQNVTVEDADVDRVITNIAERNKMTVAEFKTKIGGSLDPMKDRIKATLSWNEVVKRKFGMLINVTNRDVDKLVASSNAGASQDVDMRVQRVLINMPVKVDEGGVAKRLRLAEGIRNKFTNCKSTAEIATGVPGAKFDEYGTRRTSTFPEPTRSLLLNAADGEMLPPTVGDGGVELWVVCSRTAVKAEDEKRTEVEGELKQKEFEVMARRYLKDLREDAHIEYR